jgi:error-prone DNA polymerase
MTEYVELHAHSYYSLLEGASPPEDLLRRAVELGMDALALTDHDAVYGAVPFVKHARELGIRPILGAELTLAGESDPHHLTLLVENATGWANLCQLITLARHHAPKGEALVPEALLAEHTDGLIALSGCRLGAVTAALRRMIRQPQCKPPGIIGTCSGVTTSTSNYSTIDCRTTSG